MSTQKADPQPKKDTVTIRKEKVKKFTFYGISMTSSKYKWTHAFLLLAFLAGWVLVSIYTANFIVDIGISTFLNNGQFPNIIDLQSFAGWIFWVVVLIFVRISMKQLKKASETVVYEKEV